MVKLTVLYGPPSDPAAFDEYYLGTHVPIADAIPGLRRNEVSKVAGTLDGCPALYHLQAELYFDSFDALTAALGSPEGAAAADVPKFAPGGVTMMMSEVLKET
ncbi:MAG TPA: EthD family reductase [Acidimicrobiales bacterium]|jgi:uncharacterized protein (TIGR02118 family)